MFTNANIRNYFGGKLTTTIHTNVSEIETDASLPDWSTVEVKAYLNERVETVVIMHTTLCCPKIINASFDLFPT